MRGSRLERGYFFMNLKHPQKENIRATAFFDGQNLFHTAKNTFNHEHPNYDPVKLAELVCQAQSWRLQETRFYTGVPDSKDNAFWNHFWTIKLGVLKRQKNVFVFSRPLRYRPRTITLPTGKTETLLIGEEKGIDVRIAIDVIRLAHKQVYDVALIFSQDQDLSEAAEEVRAIAKEQNRWIKVACAFPFGQGNKNDRGIDKTDWIKIDRELYDRCLDLRDYRPKK